MEELQQGAFGPIYTQFESQPKEAMTHLCNVKELLTAFDLRPISRKNPQRAKEMKKAPKR